MVLTGPWTPEAAEAVRDGHVDRLVLNYALGFTEPSLDFLEGLPLRELVILAPQLSDLEPVHTLAPTLQALHVSTNSTLKLDLGRLPRLQELAAAWPQVVSSIDALAGLRVAFLRGYQPTDLRPLAPLTGLTDLVMKDRPKIKSLVGLSTLSSLRLLGIYLAKDLADVEDLDGRSAIEDLALESCRKIQRLDALAGCTGLRRLNLSECGDLASLAPIRALTKLEQVSMFGSTKIKDDDLEPLLALPRLRQLRMQSRRSYRPSLEEIQALLPRA
ncbi:hypothetical protein [Arthrobacter bambusae]|uniref:Leucine-rich repeat (LRR) protein n=2 Tax=Arthrobacter TaxID=1663 RepID=A0AAW8DH86_9MICC|nr:hypothetical protein [Arthrobacter bambusae]MDP9904514.1 Leucine-rich repeat (LRR) protein [Arthrobacter bambusae]MDQ0181057.1 Leucine-rich repeat (LRR) protein [Arthrobacter bambusae]